MQENKRFPLLNICIEVIFIFKLPSKPSVKCMNYRAKNVLYFKCISEQKTELFEYKVFSVQSICYQTETVSFIETSYIPSFHYMLEEFSSDIHVETNHLLVWKQKHQR